MSAHCNPMAGMMGSPMTAMSMTPGSPVTPEFGWEETQIQRPKKALPAEWSAVTMELSQFSKPTPESANESEFICTFDNCGKVFTSAPGLREHERLHSGAAPYVCPVVGCGRSFKWRSSAAMHKKSHAFRAANGKRGRRRIKKQEPKQEPKMEPKMEPKVSSVCETQSTPVSVRSEAKIDFSDLSLFEPIGDDPVTSCTTSTIDDDIMLDSMFDTLPLQDFDLEFKQNQVDETQAAFWGVEAPLMETTYNSIYF
mmetsp:Transcript_1151/g.3560  ORF Transcript_1151/g.3560 Transcript_1151/m.3560 type:complete len:254 (-) Transcript_1151:113-874(-)|eukprot:CAMPEP_0198726106 /NCGR_PEP_ID=MMETSP1475-20131203/3269_1 /TAXON_ID= ORGANISM="Unidentified sp., Strain CCMP1999" /NCGR_SAMPLE_ID=MMETSP1475 /ASSEMBLY_ACC=CAM_ASM_001111 /LENGTH=253 /DNA_ID=CAMNT_0044487995 /DNA_START=33 /DNA_END=794 /DNA_ORIENTATION=-